MIVQRYKMAYNRAALYPSGGGLIHFRSQLRADFWTSPVACGTPQSLSHCRHGYA